MHDLHRRLKQPAKVHSRRVPGDLHQVPRGQQRARQHLLQVRPQDHRGSVAVAHIVIVRLQYLKHYFQK